MPALTKAQKARLSYRTPQAKPASKANGFKPRFSKDCFNSQPEKHTTIHRKLNHLGGLTCKVKSGALPNYLR